jgi:LysR family transcriptional activator of nhaA
MARLNYHHLHYFWVVAREGSVTGAARALDVTQPTVSAQIGKLEDALGRDLFHRHGNRLELTDQGRLVQRYAADIFSLGESLEDALERDGVGSPDRFAVGISDSLPLLSAHHLLEPALCLPVSRLRLVCRVDKMDRLLAGLAARTLDLVLSDTATGPTSPVRAHDHLLAESPVVVYGTPELEGAMSAPFPEGLDGAPFLLHTENTPLRRGLDAWFAGRGIRPRVAGEVEDVALLQVLGQSGRGFFAAPALVEDEICRRYGVKVVGRLDDEVERFFGLTLEAEPDNPGVRRVLESCPAGG